MFYVNLSKVEDVKKFIKVSQDRLCEVVLKSGKYIVDGKSILGVFSLDLSSPIQLEVSDDDYSVFEPFRVNSEV